MRAVQIVDYGGPSAVRLSTIPEPPPPADRPAVFIEVHAAGVAFPEVLQSRGRYQVKPDLPFVPGGEVAGIVRQAPGGSGLQPGDRVFAYCDTGGFAEAAWADPDRVFRLPDRLTFTDGAALFANYHTAYFALVERGRATAGESVLIHGAGGGLGTATVQLARALGLKVLAVVSDGRKADAARRAGAHHVIHRDEGWKDRALELVPGGVDLVVDPVSTEVVDDLRVMRELGRLLIVGFAGGELPMIPANRLLLRNLEVIGVVYGSFAFARPGYSRSMQDHLDPLLDQGISPIVGETFRLDEASLALAQLEDRHAVGKVVLLMDQPSRPSK